MNAHELIDKVCSMGWNITVEREMLDVTTRVNRGTPAVLPGLMTIRVDKQYTSYEELMLDMAALVGWQQGTLVPTMDGEAVARLIDLAELPRD